MIRRGLLWLGILCWALWSPVIALAQLDPQNMPSPSLPLAGSEPIVCVQGNAFKKCTPNTLFGGAANLILATPNGASGSAILRAMVDPDIPVTGVTAGSYTCSNLTVLATGRLTAASNGACNTINAVIPGYSCTNTGGIITCTQPCDAWPIVVCATTTNGAVAAPLTLAAKPAIGDVLVAFANNASATVGAGWTSVAACDAGGFPVHYQQPGMAYHVVTPGDSVLYTPFTGPSGNAMAQGVVDVTALGAAGGSWAAAFNSMSCSGGQASPVTVSGTTPAAGAVQVAVGLQSAASGSTATTYSLTGVALDPQYGAANNAGPNATMGVAYAVGGSSGSAYSATWNTNGGGVGGTDYIGVAFFNAGPSFSVPTCTVSSGTCAMTNQSGPAALYMTLSGASAATTLTVANLPLVANAYTCQVAGDRTTGTIWAIQSGWSATGATFTFYTKGSATAASPGATDVITTSCWGA